MNRYAVSSKRRVLKYCCGRILQNFLVSLGGDGTLLSLVRRSYAYQKPVVGINAGNLGFLADITIEDVDSFLERLLVGEYRVDNRMMI